MHFLNESDLNGDAPSWPGADAAINLAVIYEDSPTREWARVACKLVNELAGVDCMRSRAWSVEQLNDPAVFPRAVRIAAVADVIILALHAGAELPLPLHAWFDAWLPQRDLPVGALVSLMSVGGSKALSSSVREYLGAVARRGRLDLLIEEQKLPSFPFKAVKNERSYKPARGALSTWILELSNRWSHLGIND